MKIKVIIPAYNEEKAIGQVINEIPQALVSEIIIVDNNSTDNTALVAKEHGATVIHQPLQGYGNACLKGMEWVANQADKPDIIVFLDGDHSDYPDRMGELVQPIIDGRADFVIGSRALGGAEKGSMTPPQIFGNWLATRLIKIFFGYRFTDLGPFRAIAYPTLLEMNMVDKTYGWTVEMQIKAAKQKVRAIEIAVPYRNRIGFSKISGTVKGTVLAGYKILWTIFKYL